MVPLDLIVVVFRSTHAETVTGRIVAVADGDTITLLDETLQLHKIRLAGIDAPEKKQEFGQKAKSALSTLAYGEAATADCRKRDLYQREICVVRVKGKDVGLGQIAAGLAWWYRHYSKEQSAQERSDYEQAESDARSHRFGVWVSQNPRPPCEWRHGGATSLVPH